MPDRPRFRRPPRATPELALQRVPLVYRIVTNGITNKTRIEFDLPDPPLPGFTTPGQTLAEWMTETDARLIIFDGLVAYVLSSDAIGDYGPDYVQWDEAHPGTKVTAEFNDINGLNVPMFVEPLRAWIDTTTRAIVTSIA